MAQHEYTVHLPGSPRLAGTPLRPWRSRKWIVLLSLVLCTTLLSLGAQHPSVNASFLGNGYSSASSDLYDTVRTAIESATRMNTSVEALAWTEGEPGEGLPMFIGTPLTFIKLSNENVIDSRTGKPFDEKMEGGTFNLAVLKMPPNSDFQFLGIARGPTRWRNFIHVNAHPAREQSLLVFGLNIKLDGSLHAVTEAHALDYQQIPRKACEVSGLWIATYGIEDARIFWTDAGTPAITIGRSSDSTDICRVVGLIPDLRRFLPFVHNAVKPNAKYGISAYSPHVVPGQGESFELKRMGRSGKIEKNWAAFYPGPRPNPAVLYPFISYTVAPAQLMEVESSTPRSINYAPQPDDPMSKETYECVSRHHKHFTVGALHHASPLYRLTLCARGECQANDGNMVNVAVAHAKLGRRYAKYFITYNITAPFNPISVGPAVFVRGGGVDDHKTINFALSLVPIEPADLDPTVKRVNAGKGYHPGHIFADDRVLMTMGHDDRHMVSTTFSVKEMLARHKMCEEPVGA